MMKRICVISKDKKKDEGILEIDEDRLVNVTLDDGGRILVDGKSRVVPRTDGGDLDAKAIYLSHYYDYVIGFDDKGAAVLVPLKKKGDY